MSHEHAHDASGPTEGEYTDADHADGAGAVHRAEERVGEVEGQYTDGVYSADGHEVTHPHTGEGEYTDVDSEDPGAGRPDAGRS